MSARGPPNLRCWLGWGVKLAGKLGCREKFLSWRRKLNGNTTVKSQRKGVPNSCSGNSEAVRTETCADMGNKQQFRVRRTQGMRWSVMFEG